MCFVLRIKRNLNKELTGEKEILFLFFCKYIAKVKFNYFFCR